jgi:hypothetical protein
MPRDSSDSQTVKKELVSIILLHFQNTCIAVRFSDNTKNNLNPAVISY